MAYYKKWPQLAWSIGITGAFFIVWDMLKTYYGVWSFNPEYLLGIYIGNLPIEEWLFFVTVPYACVFIYECLNAYLPDYLEKPSKYIAPILIVVLPVLGIINYSRLYTFVTFTFTAAALFIYIKVFKNRLGGRFWLAYLVHLIPFFMVNGVLTALPVVIYNDAENLGIRIGTVPIEDSIYSMLLLLMNIGIFEWRQQKTLHLKA
ncbi:MAG: lycopene cyclase domain-containing protein [Sphingobacteriales bacterium JAD_PAG50586_3]|nr:MAG: lycopene cyclase domain-containing protein [Sphingobacteriales bacterium JAD_PAG50586_3]